MFRLKEYYKRYAYFIGRCNKYRLEIKDILRIGDVEK